MPEHADRRRCAIIARMQCGAARVGGGSEEGRLIAAPFTLGRLSLRGCMPAFPYRHPTASAADVGRIRAAVGGNEHPSPAFATGHILAREDRRRLHAARPSCHGERAVQALSASTKSRCQVDAGSAGVPQLVQTSPGPHAVQWCGSQSNRQCMGMAASAARASVRGRAPIGRPHLHARGLRAALP